MISRNLVSAEQLVEQNLITPAQLPGIREVIARFPMSIPPGVVELIRKRGSEALARQFIPSPEELQFRAEERLDPLGEAAYEKVKGLVHRYPDRVLLKPVPTCACICRFCFRKEQLAHAAAPLNREELAAALAYIRNAPEVWEVILSGGDPLMLGAGGLEELLTHLQEIAHVKVLRIHSRVPVVTPELITPALLAALRYPLPLYLVLHCNHPAEFTSNVQEVCRRLREAGVILMAQSVLLKGVNDNPEVLKDLFRLLVAAGVKPYYLHHCDLVRGCGHFRTGLSAGRRIREAIRGEVSGLCQPVYVLDIPGGYGKVPAHPEAVQEDGAGSFRIRDRFGHFHPYR